MFSKFQDNWGWKYLQFRISSGNAHRSLSKGNFSQPQKKLFPNYQILILLGFSPRRPANGTLIHFLSSKAFGKFCNILKTMEKCELDPTM